MSKSPVDKIKRAGEDVFDALMLRTLLWLIKNSAQNRDHQIHYTLRFAAPRTVRLAMTFRVDDGEPSTMEATGTRRDVAKAVVKLAELHFHESPSLDG
jgi:hypothetical protein